MTSRAKRALAPILVAACVGVATTGVARAGSATPLDSAQLPALWGTATDGASPVTGGDTHPMLRALTGNATLSAIANDIVGASDMAVVVEDDPVGWAALVGGSSANVSGFVVFRSKPSPFYHAIMLGPMTAPSWAKWAASGSPAGDEYNFAISAMTLIHESFHWRLFSGDESTVNACALSYFPYYLTTDFHVPATITQTVTQKVPVTTTKRVPVTKIVVARKRVEAGGKWVTRTTRHPVTTYVNETTTTLEDQATTSTVANPLYDTLVAAAQLSYSRQPPPYNSGTCPTTPPTSTPAPAPVPPGGTSGYHVKGCWVQYTGGSWAAATASAGVTSFSASDILARGAANFWGIVELNQPPTATFDGTTVALVEPNGTTFATAKLSQPWTASFLRWSIGFAWTWSSDNSLFFQHPGTTGSGAWALRWSFPDGEVCSSPFTVTG